MRKKQLLIVLSICIILSAAAFFLLGQAPNKSTLPPLTCTFLKVGKADAIVIENNGQTMVIDAGEEDDGLKITEFLQQKGVTTIDILIITHFDKDHVGGADTLISQIPADRVLLPDYEGAGTDYADFMNALEETSITPEKISAAESFSFGDARVTVEPPASYETPDNAVEYDNNFSLVTTITHGTNRMLFTGDIEKQRIREMLAAKDIQECNFLKVPHHGVYNTALEELIGTVRPQYAVICSSDKNPAETATLELLKKYGADVLETRHGNIILISSESNLELHQKIKR